MVTDLKVLNAPYFCYINLTNKCNLRCLHCLGSYTKELDDELNFNGWRRVIDELTENKVFYVNISGGEPTQHPDFVKIINYLSEKGMHFIITTNGVMSADSFKAVIENKDYLIGLKISLDGYDVESHCFIRKDSAGRYNKVIFDKTMETINKVKEQNVPLTIATVIHEKNIQNFEKFVSLIKEINPISWFISPIIPTGRGFHNTDIIKSYSFYEKSFWSKIYEHCTAARINVRLVDLPFDMRSGRAVDYYECGAALTFCEINADGKISPCTLCRICIPEEELKFDKLTEKSLKEIWQGSSFKQFRSFMKQGCNGCKAFSRCTKCIAQSFRYFSNGYSPTPYCLSNPSLGISERYCLDVK